MLYVGILSLEGVTGSLGWGPGWRGVAGGDRGDQVFQWREVAVQARICGCWGDLCGCCGDLCGCQWRQGGG